MDISIQKQILINKIGNNQNLPDELIDIIKSLNFYDMKTYSIILNAKYKKAEINHIIKNVLVFYNYNYVQNKNYNRWGVIMYSLDDTIPFIHINNDICNNCGNYCGYYINSQLNAHLPTKIICRCDL